MHRIISRVLPQSTNLSSYLTFSLIKRFHFDRDPNKPAKVGAVVKQKLTEALQPTFLHILDESNCDCGIKFYVTVVSEKFKGKSLVQRHRLVQEPIKVEIEKDIHAFSQKPYSPEEWEEFKKKNPNWALNFP